MVCELTKINIKQIILFLTFVGFSIGSVVLMTATFYVAPMTIYLPFTVEPVIISGADVGAVLGIGAIASLYLLLETGKK